MNEKIQDIENNINRLVMKIKLEQKEITEKYRIISEYSAEITRLKFMKKDLENDNLHQVNDRA